MVPKVAETTYTVALTRVLLLQEGEGGSIMMKIEPFHGPPTHSSLSQEASNNATSRAQIETNTKTVLNCVWQYRHLGKLHGWPVVSQH